MSYFGNAPDDASTLAISPFALAFLVGYNLDVLFLSMDRIIQALNHTIGERLQNNNRKNQAAASKTARPKQSQDMEKRQSDPVRSTS
uniref:Uncharacterized protein n=1 Tax=Candidatus Kentrum sp. FM TaxID=2126340 RepID=A0A450U365_9GAMM|nr:MAG: hypothetical protein BECKFM1743A_GA0114220_104694 [Candidatus Kentron sp. FM]VFJ69986.1 MAG: hypothetical protein BECKFM1743C_GA0114222_105391 [Candidatus Kentron sp. FM]VFJ77580.1 MAG: hypothetical protein BECKFM1743A_GA0114220_110041 [Candidatus Kentron sp. FM]VFK09693.1 MAG: hypothetical protein BECKFM1743B_GA0114221_101131 [Candidatus Kentron sp. FM]VFK24147.1 MAG: hypothetical protein BECKFM1743B_GA0114221_109721 [Candidatus Kentron sp. FM]